MVGKYYYDVRYDTNRVQKYLYMHRMRVETPHHSLFALFISLKQAAVRGVFDQSFTPRALMAVAGA